MMHKSLLNQRFTINYSLFILLAVVLVLIPGKSNGQINGRCIDAQNGLPVSEARISSNSNVLTVTNQAGYFTLDADSSLEVSVSHTGYHTMTREVSPGGEKLFLLFPKNQEIDEVTVSAPLLDYQSKKVPAGFAVVPPDTLHPELEAIDIIEQSPGVIMQKGARNTGRILIRGIGSRSPYATTRIRAYWDDIPLTSGDGHTTVEDLEMYNTARTEVVRGPSSALYGSGLGGVIVFHPEHTQQSPFSIEGLYQYGPFDQKKGLIHAGAKKNQTVIKGTGSYVETEGFRENSDYERYNGQFLLRKHYTNHTLSLLAGYIHLNAQIPSSLDKETYRNEPGNAAENWLGVEGFEEYDKWLSGVSWQAGFTEKIDNKLSVFLNHTNAYESRPFNILDDRMLTYGVRNEATWNQENWKITGGAEIFNERYDWKLKETLDGREGATFANNHETRRFINIFAKTDYNLSPGWRISAGANLHFLKFRLEDNFQDDEDLSGSYRYNPVLSPRLGFTGDLSSELTLFGSAGHGFSPPSVEETLLPEGSINPDLKPEEGYNFDMGLRGSLLNDRLNFDITAYHIALENLLVTKRETEEIFYGINAGESRHKGLETLIKGNITPKRSPVNMNLNITHTWMDNKFETFVDDGVDHSGNQLPGVPEHHLRTSLKTGYADKIRLNLEWIHSGSMFLDDANTKKYPGHHLFNLKASWNIFTGNSANAQIQAGLNNILDRHHAAMVLVNAPSYGGSAPRHYYPGAPRNAYLRLTMRFR